MNNDEQILTDGGWRGNPDGTWTLTKSFEGYNAKRQLTHVGVGVTRTMAEALELESLRPVEPSDKLQRSAAKTDQASAGIQVAMERLEARTNPNPTSVPAVGAPQVPTPTKEDVE